ncbi:MAG: UDP-N-acetylmuramoyl-tripeptide--D-alanyl-D-alanine ligase [Pedosphaera sp.]|nr:UDP-N-acetylmuramoyl-tripeptide--D-alanyl-D-alanine ligase [Pedosphaera sp.]
MEPNRRWGRGRIMDFRSLKFVASACAGEQLCGSPELRVNSVCSDSRQAQAGDLFFALAGERFDGHEFVLEVAKKGVAALVLDRARVPDGLSGCAVIAVENPRQALGRLAARYRADFDLPMIAVGGSNGKTTTKELVAAVLRQKFKTLWSEASFNNDIGVPLTLLKLAPTQQAAVLEVGTNHPGELAPLVRMIQPKFGIITNIGREHLEFFGDLAGVAGEEGWLAELLPVDGMLFVNGDSEWTEPLARRSRATVVRVGLAERNDWRADDMKMDPEGVTFQVRAPRPEFGGEYRINLLGRHQVVNALFAIAAGAELGLSAAEIRRGLNECKSAKMRLQSWNWNGVCVLDDTYNANADSMLAALQTLQELSCSGRRVAVLGDMGELGDHAAAAHEEVGRKAAQIGADQLFVVGKMAGITAQAAREAGMKAVVEFADVPAAAEAVKRFLKSGDLVLLKASRSARLERIGEALRAESVTRKV